MKKRRLWLIQFILCLGLIASVVLALNCGYSKIHFSALWEEVFCSTQGSSSLILLNIRLPRILLAALCGMGLALSGCTLQAVTDNPLADPGILGINSGAGFFVMLFMGLFPALHIDAKLYQPIFAMVGGLLTAFLLYSFARRNGKFRPTHFLLGGIGVAAGFSACPYVAPVDFVREDGETLRIFVATDSCDSMAYEGRISFEYGRQADLAAIFDEAMVKRLEE